MAHPPPNRYPLLEVETGHSPEGHGFLIGMMTKEYRERTGRETVKALWLVI